MKNEELALAMSRIVDRDESPSDWELFETVAAREASVWMELGKTLQDDCRLKAALAVKVERMGDDTPSVGGSPIPRPSPRKHRLRWTVGLLAALVLALLYFVVGPNWGKSQTAEQRLTGLLTQYLEQGREAGQVIQELPRLTLKLKEHADSGEIEVLYVRRILERGRAKQVWQILPDEHGELQPIPIAHRDMSKFREASSF